MRLSIILVLIISVSGCTSIKSLNLKRSEIGILGNYDVSTFSDYGNDVVYYNKSGSHRYDIYLGGFGGCGGDLLVYAKPKMDAFMTSNGFTDYTVTEVHHQLSPPTKCILFIKYEK